MFDLNSCNKKRLVGPSRRDFREQRMNEIFAGRVFVALDLKRFSCGFSLKA
jgi:hypothetical protein